MEPVRRKSLKVNKDDEEVGHEDSHNPLSQRISPPLWTTISISLEFIVVLVLWFVAGTSEDDYQQYLKNSVSDFDINESLFDIFMITVLKDLILFALFYDLRKFKSTIWEFVGYSLPILDLIYIIVKLVLMASDDFAGINGGGVYGGIILGLNMTFSLIQVGSVYNVPKVLNAIQYQKIGNYDNLDAGQKSRIDETMGKSNTSIYRVIALVKPEYTIIFFAMIALFVNSLSQVAIPFIFGIVVDALVDGDRRPGNETVNGLVLNIFLKDEREPEEKLNAAIVLLLIIFVIGSISGFVRGWLFTLAGQRVVARLRKDLFFAVVKQEVAFFDRTRTGELTSRLTSDTQVLQNAVTTNISMLVRYLVQILFSIVILFILSWKLALVMFAVVPFVAIGAVIYGRFIQKKQKEFQDELAAATTVAEEVISNIRTVRAFSKEQKSSDKYSAAVEKSYIIGRTIAIAYGIFTGVLGFIPQAAIALIFWYGGTLVLEGELTTGTLTSFLLYTLNVALAFAFLSGLFGDFMQAVGASSRVFQLIDRVPEIPISGGKNIPNMKGKVEFSNVSFTYPTRPDSIVLNDVTLELEPGKVLALVGPSGGGKSTTVGLLERFYDVTSGAVVIDGVNVKDLDPVWYRSNVALVSQEPVLFADTIRENICYGVDRIVTRQEIEEAAIKANAHNFIIGFSEQYDTAVGERGVRLSGGQKQRIAIARALLMNPKILLLDEATSALDAESEYLVQEAIERAMENRTVLVIAHRLSTVKNADIIAVLSGGTVVEKGTHQELLEKDGLYRKLVNRQLQGADDMNQVFSEITGETRKEEAKEDSKKD